MRDLSLSIPCSEGWVWLQRASPRDQPHQSFLLLFILVSPGVPQLKVWCSCCRAGLLQTPVHGENPPVGAGEPQHRVPRRPLQRQRGAHRGHLAQIPAGQLGRAVPRGPTGSAGLREPRAVSLKWV